MRNNAGASSCSCRRFARTQWRIFVSDPYKPNIFVRSICNTQQVMGSVPFVTCMHRATQASVTPKPPVSSSLLLRQLNKCPKAFGGQSRRRCKRAASQPKASTAQQAPASAKVAVEQGLEAFANGDTTEALRLFRKGLSMNPSKDEARAALYNMACCLVKEKKWQAAADAVSDACNNYGLKYAVALKVTNAHLHPCVYTKLWL